MNNAFVCKCTLGGKSSFCPFISALARIYRSLRCYSCCRTDLCCMQNTITTTINKWDCNVSCIRANRYAAESALLIKWFGLYYYSHSCGWNSGEQERLIAIYVDFNERKLSTLRKVKESAVFCQMYGWSLVFVFVTVQFLLGFASARAIVPLST